VADLSDIITRTYNGFRGVDFTGGIVQNYRSPDALNMWKNYADDDAVQTRPGMTFINNFGGKVVNVYFLKDARNVLHCLLHVDTKLIEWSNYPATPVTLVERYVGMNPNKSMGFIFKETLFLIDGVKYLEYDGISVSEVVGTIPLTSYMKNPDGSTNIDEDTDTDLVYQPVNVLNSKRRNGFIADGTSTVYKLDAQNLDPASTYLMHAEISNASSVTDLVENVGFTVDRTKGWVTFNTAPAEGMDVYITYSKTAQGYKERILNSTLVTGFDNRVFFSGNPDYPSTVFWSQLNDPRYIADINYEECGQNHALIKAIIPGNGVLWVIKEMEQNNSSVYYLTPTIDANYGKIYPSVNGSINLGCVGCGTNFNDDVVFFSKRGLEGISSSSLYSEQILQHRSSMVDSKLISESNYQDIKLAEYEGYLLCLVNSHIYLADSRAKFQNISNDIEYDWYYWELPNSITFIKEYRGTLLLANNNGDLYALGGNDDNGSNILSYWCTRMDDFGYPSMRKNTNKRGNVVDFKVLNNDNITLEAYSDGELKKSLVLSDETGHAIFKVKCKKFKESQIKLKSNERFGIFKIVLQGFVSGFLKK
jgi:hypothetical protein